MNDLAPLFPDDEYNRTLRQHVRPPGWRNPTPRERYHLVVIGAGTAGLVTAAAAAGLGAKVALVERQMMGGDCLNVGCVPSKSLLAAARSVAGVRRAGEFGVRVPEGVHVDFPAVMQRMRRLRAGISPHDSAARFRDLGVDVFLGNASFRDDEVILVDDAELRFRSAVIATGARAAAPPIEGLPDVPYLTNETVFSLTELPQRLGIVGAGPIGCELAQAFARFGSQVYLVEATHGVLPREDPEASELVAEALGRDGVTLLCCGENLRVEPAGSAVRLGVISHKADHQVVVDRLLVATGRAPNVEGLNLPVAGVNFDLTHGVLVDDRLRTSNPRIFAAGDVCSPLKFTHAADFMARTVVQNALFPISSRFRSETVPWCTYTSPELARIGITEREAEEQGLQVNTFKVDLQSVDRALLDGTTTGFVKIHTAKSGDRIRGATIVAENAGDLIGQLSMAMTHDLGLKALAKTVHPYPTLAESLRKAGDLYNRSRLTPLVTKAIAGWLDWQR